MSKSLQDQLMALGLAKKKSNSAVAQKKGHRPRLAKPETASRNSTESPTPVHREKARSSELSLEAAYRLRELQTRQQAELDRERKQLEDRRRRQLNNEIRAIVDPHRLNDPAADLSRNFMYKGRIRKVSVTAEQLKALNEGQLGLVYLAGGYHLLAPEHIAQVRSLSEDHVPDLSGSTDEDTEFPVPDDLIW